MKHQVPRARLLDRLIEARQKACILFQGPAGSGKTSAALQWRTHMLSYGYDFAWVTITSGDDADALLDQVFSSLDGVDPAIAREASFIYNRDSNLHSAEAIAIHLVQGIARYPRSIVLMFDDYQSISDSRIHEFTQALLDFASPNLCIALASRSSPPLSLSRLRAKNEILEIGFRDLRFSFKETQDFLLSRRSNLERRDIRILYDLTDGWVAGLQLVSLDLNTSSSPPTAKSVQNADEFAEYFNREVLAQLSDDDIDALSRLSVAKRFNRAMCSALFGAEQGQALFERLSRENFFLIPVDDASHESWYRFHPLFRGLLLNRFNGLGLQERRQVHATISLWFARRNLLREAVQHCLAAGDTDKAADLLEQHARDMFLNGQLRRLVSALNELPHAAIQQRPALRLWLAWSQLCYRELQKCHESIASLKSTLSPSDLDMKLHMTLLEGSLAIQNDSTTEGLNLIPRLEAMQPASDAILIGGRRNILTWLYTHLGRFDEAREAQKGGTPLLEDGSPLLDSAFGVLTGQSIIGFTYLHAGEIRRAERVLREVLDTSERALGIYCEPACHAAAFLGDVLYEINELDDARELLEPRMDVINQVSLPDTLLRATVMLARIHDMQGNRQEAVSYLDQLDEQAHGRGLDRLMAHSLAERVWMHLRSNEIDDAKAAICMLDSLAQPWKPDDAPVGAKIFLLQQLSRVRYLSSIGSNLEARDIVSSLLSIPSLLGQRRIGAQLIIKLAVLEARLGNSAAARQHGVEALTLSQELGLVRSLLDHGEEFMNLAQDAVSSDAPTSLNRFFLSQLREHTKAKPGGAKQVNADAGKAQGQESLSERELEIVKALASAMPNKRIALALGISPETVKWHLKNIYSKLDVQGRDGAIAKARNLGWLD